MTGDQNKFVSLKKEKGGNVMFGDNSFAKIIGTCIVSLGNEKTKVENVLLVEDLKHNIDIVNQMCDQGHNLAFNS